MASLGDTLAELLANARAASSAEMHASGTEDLLQQTPSFGPNPGALRMWLHVPGELPAKAPLVVVLHGCGQTAAGYAAGAGWLELADRHGFVVLCPEQVRANNPNLCFNWFEDADAARGAGEAASIAQMVRHALVESPIDPSRVFITGLSAGGAMATVMLATYPEMFAAGAIIAGLPYGAASGMSQALAAMRSIPALSARTWGDKVRAAAPRPKRWPSVAIWHGDADTTVAPGAARALALQWCDVHGVTRSVPGRAATSRHDHISCLSPDGTVAVALHSISGLGHGTPIASNGEDGCGSPAPWILEAGLSSSTQIACSWGVLSDLRPRATAQKTAREPRGGDGSADRPHLTSKPDVGDTIARALREAGLLR